MDRPHPIPQPMPGHLIFRADGDARSGTGHVMRCLALAAGWQATGGTAAWITTGLTPALLDAIRARGIPVNTLAAVPGSSEDARQTAAQANTLPAADWVVMDGYQFDAAYQSLLQAAGLRILFFDDYGHAGQYSAELVLNQNVGATSDLYSRRGPATQLLLGARFALLREEFRGASGGSRTVADRGQRVLVTLGGSDPDDVTGRVVVTALTGLLQQGVEAVVVIGGSNPHAARLREQCAAAGPGLTVEQNSPRMAELMAWADLAIAAGGTTVWELAALGVPMLLLVLARNQVELAAHAHSSGLARSLGPAVDVTPAWVAQTVADLLADPVARQAMSAAAHREVDGQGVTRVIHRLRSPMLDLRAAVSETDSRLLWTWANDPVTRAVSFEPESIPWESHRNWFAARSASPNCRLWIAGFRTAANLGVIRFDLEGPQAVISINVAPEHRGHGWGALLIGAAIRQLFISTPSVRSVVARIKPDNIASIRAFSQAGFVPVRNPSLPADEPLRFELSRDDAGL